MPRKSFGKYPLSLIMAAAASAAAGAVAAAGGLSLLFIPHHDADNQDNHCQKNKANSNCTDILTNPLQHKNHSISKQTPLEPGSLPGSGIRNIKPWTAW